MSNEPRKGGRERALLRVFTFEAGDHLFAVRASDVGRILSAGQEIPEGTSVVDAVGLLSRAEGRSARTCVVLLAPSSPDEPPVAITASRALEVGEINPEALLPLPGYLFRGESPFLGLVPPGGSSAGRALFLFGGPARILAAASSA